MVKPEAPGAPMKLRYSIGKGTIQPNQGVLHYKLNGEDHAVEIALDWPAS